ncbi:MAG TPA: FtsX-like permease family protein [Terriglobales bacterium]|nr:FtsX-like permease family protein [Terriglobales bacterium]
MMNKLIVANLANRPVRSVISIAAIALEVTLILLIVGFALGMLHDSQARQAGIGADVIVLPPASSNIVGLTDAAIPVKMIDVLGKLPHIAVISPVILKVSTAGTLQTVWGIDLASFDALRPFTYLKGGPFQGPDDILVDDIYTNGKHVDIGDSVEFFNHKFRIAGIVAHGRGARLFVPLTTLQEMNGTPGRASMLYVKADTVANTNLVVNELKNFRGMSTYVVQSMSEYLSTFTPEKYPMLSTFINIVVGISVTIGFIVIFQAMYAAVMERTREIGILKSLGASRLYIVNVVLRETTLLAIAGIIVGVILSFVASLAIRQRTTLPVHITSGWILRATIIAIVGSILGAAYPAFKAAQKDPIDALAYE